MLKNGVPVTGGCVLCTAAAQRMDPGLSFGDVCEKIHNPPLKTPHYGTDFQRARVAIGEEVECNKNRTLPVFVPAASVSEQQIYGHQAARA